MVHLKINPSKIRRFLFGNHHFQVPLWNFGGTVFFYEFSLPWGQLMWQKDLRISSFLLRIIPSIIMIIMVISFNIKRYCRYGQCTILWPLVNQIGASIAQMPGWSPGTPIVSLGQLPNISASSTVAISVNHHLCWSWLEVEIRFQPHVTSFPLPCAMIASQLLQW